MEKEKEKGHVRTCSVCSSHYLSRFSFYPSTPSTHHPLSVLIHLKSRDASSAVTKLRLSIGIYPMIHAKYPVPGTLFTYNIRLYVLYV